MPDEKAHWDELMAAHHYLGFDRLTGETLKYVAVLGDEWVALIGWGSAALKCNARDTWIGWAPEQQWERLKFIANNQRFLILPDYHLPNLASKTLALNLRRLSMDWQALYNHPVLLAETFVDPSRFRGVCYRAANWLYVGDTSGYGRNGGRYYHHGQSKMVWIHPLYPKAKSWLSAPFPAPILQGKEHDIMDLNTLVIEGSGGLYDYLAMLPECRSKRGIRHRLDAILGISICAMLSGARSFVAIGQWAAKLPQDALRRFGCRYDCDQKKHIPPSEPTIRRTLQNVDAEAVDLLVGKWLYNQAEKKEKDAEDGVAIAIDGKTLRGSSCKDSKPVHLLSALLHGQKVVVSQCQVDKKTNEITALKPLLDPLNIKDAVVTADALHTQVNHARYLVEEKQADYLFTVKTNQPTLHDDIASLAESDFSPSDDHT